MNRHPQQIVPGAVGKADLSLIPGSTRVSIQALQMPEGAHARLEYSKEGLTGSGGLERDVEWKKCREEECEIGLLCEERGLL